MENADSNSTRIGWREKLRLMLEGAGTIVGVPVGTKVPTGSEIVIGKTKYSDLVSDSDIVIPSGGGSLFSADTDPVAFKELCDFIDQETKGSGTK